MSREFRGKAPSRPGRQLGADLSSLHLVAMMIDGCTRPFCCDVLSGIDS